MLDRLSEASNITKQHYGKIPTSEDIRIDLTLPVVLKITCSALSVVASILGRLIALNVPPRGRNLVSILSHGFTYLWQADLCALALTVKPCPTEGRVGSTWRRTYSMYVQYLPQ